MTPWDVIEEALRRRKPPRDQKWLAEQIGVQAQAITNWKARRVPPAQLRKVAQVLGLTVDQIEGYAPVPWAKELPWPFSPELHDRITSLAAPVISQLEESLWVGIQQLETDSRIGHARDQRITRTSPMEVGNGSGTVELIESLTATERSRDEKHRIGKSGAHAKHQDGSRKGPRKTR